MCILVYVPQARHFPFEHLGAMLRANGDGAGFVYWDPARGKAKIKRFLTTLTPRVEPAQFMPDIEDSGNPGRAGVVPERLAKLNLWRVKTGKPRVDEWDVYHDPDSQKYVEWLTGGNLVDSLRKSKRAEYSPPKVITFVDERAVEEALASVPAKAPLVFHARMCTHGTVTLDNVHPFRVPGSNAVLAHNGTISGLGRANYGYGNVSSGDEGMSDTRELAHVMLRGMSYKQIKAAGPLIEHIGDWSKFAIMDGRTGDVTCLGKWARQDRDTGVAYSNLNFLPTRPHVPYQATTAPSAPAKPSTFDQRVTELAAAQIATIRDDSGWE